MHIVRTVKDLRALQSGLKAQGRTSALVPTMGALHAGHLALVAAAKGHADAVIATIFVNPTQFAAHEDLGTYPRQEAADLEALDAAGVDAVFAPSVDEIYGPDDATRIVMAGPAAGLEAAFRPHFFGGVATVVSRLLLAAGCEAAVFGEKDYQQLLVIKRMVADLKIPTAIHGAPTVREDDGLALSSRNAYLSAEERATAPALNQALRACAAAVRGGLEPDVAEAQAVETLQSAGFAPDYLAVRDADTLGPLTAMDRGRVLAAATLGRTRLIDNIAL